MKWIHLADLHIGRQHEAADLEPDQKSMLNEIIHIVRTHAPDGVLIAGDVYDRSVPSERAVRMLNDFLLSLVSICPVYMISGNHDSGSRLSFAASLLTHQGLHIAGQYNGTLRPISSGDTDIYLLPYLHPVQVRRVLQDPTITTMQDATRAVLQTREAGKGKHSILVAHQLVLGARSALRDEAITIGTLDHVDYSLFDDFDYVALGHIHRPQPVGRETVRYAGSPMMYSFSDEKQEKGITLYDPCAPCPVQHIPLTSPRRMRKVRGTLEQLLTPGFDPLCDRRNDIVLAQLTDPQVQIFAKEKLQQKYETVLVNYVNIHLNDHIAGARRQDICLNDPLALFEVFYQDRTGETISAQQREIVSSLIRQVQEVESCS